ncbi:MAG: hypothetical protein Q8R44_08030 [Novosphingobium sp.]|nr:hypothetical protein [Novosphingobium sp.]
MNIPIRERFMAAAALAGLIVAGCDRKPDERSKAAGEVLEGTISDAMIAPDRVRSEPPIAPRKAGPSDAKGEKAKPRSSDEVEPGESPAPESSPAAQASPSPEATPSEPSG